MASGGVMDLIKGGALHKVVPKVSQLPELMLSSPAEAGAEIEAIAALLIGPDAAAKLMGALKGDAMNAIKAEMEKQLAAHGVDQGLYGEVARAMLTNTGQYLLQHGMEGLTLQMNKITEASGVEEMQAALVDVAKVVMGEAAFAKVVAHCIESAMQQLASALERQHMEPKYVVVVQTIAMHMASGGVMDLIKGGALHKVVPKVSQLPELMLSSPAKAGAEIEAIAALLIGPDAAAKLMGGCTEGRCDA